MIHLTCDYEHGLMKTRGPVNLLFRTMFDCQVVEKFPVEAFMPWMQIENYLKDPPDRKLSALYQEKSGYFYLLKIRPKLDIGLENRQDCEEHRFFHFLELVCSGSKNDIFIPQVEKLLPGIGYNLIRYGGLKYATKTKYIKVDELVRIFNILAKHEHFQTGAFTTSAKLSAKSRDDQEIITDALTTQRNVTDETDEGDDDSENDFSSETVKFKNDGWDLSLIHI